MGFFACTKHEANPDDNNEFPLKLNIKKLSDGNLQLSWDKVNVTGFSQYILTRQSDTTFFNNASDTSWVIDDFNKNQIIDKNLPIEQYLYYRISAKSINGVNLESALTPFEQTDILSVKNLVFTNITPNLSKNLFYIYNQNNSVSTYNIKTKTVNRNAIQTVQFNNFIFNCFPETPNDVFFRENSANDQKILDPDTLSVKISFPFDGTYYIQSAISNNSNLYYTTNSDSYGGVKVYDATSKKYIQDYKITNYFASSRNLRYLPSAKKLYMIENGNTTNIMSFNLDNNGTILNRLIVNLNTEWNSTFMFSPTQSQIISLTTGNVYNASLTKINTIKNLKSVFIASFSPDGKYFAYFDNAFTINILDTQTFSIVKSYAVGNQFSSSQKSNFTSFGLTDDKLVLVYSKFNNFGSRDLNIIFKNIN